VPENSPADGIRWGTVAIEWLIVHCIDNQPNPGHEVDLLIDQGTHLSPLETVAGC